MSVGSLFMVTAFLLLGMEKLKDEVQHEIVAGEARATRPTSGLRHVARLGAR